MDTFLEFCRWFGDFSVWAGFVITILMLSLFLLGGFMKMVKVGFNAWEFLMYGCFIFCLAILAIIVFMGGFQLY